jgi:hypothetical protein
VPPDDGAVSRPSVHVRVRLFVNMVRTTELEQSAGCSRWACQKTTIRGGSYRPAAVRGEIETIGDGWLRPAGATRLALREANRLLSGHRPVCLVTTSRIVPPKPERK